MKREQLRFGKSDFLYQERIIPDLRSQKTTQAANPNHPHGPCLAFGRSTEKFMGEAQMGFDADTTEFNRHEALD